MPAVTARASAKVNLLLEVGPRRDDGYHDLVTVFQAISLTEDVTAEARSRSDVTVSVQATEGVDTRGIPLDASNLAVRAARLLIRHTGMHTGVHLTIRKSVPVAAGMAGGSADAAAALVACDALFATHLGLPVLGELGAELGADVPFAVHGRTAVGTGRGDQLAPVMTTGSFHWVLVLSAHGLATPAVYAEHDRLTASRPDAGRLQAVETALRSGAAEELGAALANDLQEAAISLQPGLRETLRAGMRAGAVGAVVSGSGPTVALLASSRHAAADLAAALAEQYDPRLLRQAHGPVPGAHVLEAVRAHQSRSATAGDD